MTDYKEYMKTLEEQIQNKRARALVSEEINGHIEEQAQGYEEEGMSREDAKREAVRQMGDPVETKTAEKTGSKKDCRMLARLDRRNISIQDIF